MKKLWTVFQFELMDYLKDKHFMLITVLLALLLFGATFLPHVIDMSDMLGIESTVTKDEEEDKDETEEKSKFGIVDTKGYFPDVSVVEQVLADAEIVFVDSESELKKKVENGELEAGFYVEDALHYSYYILNRSMDDMNQYSFEMLLMNINKQLYCAEHGLDYQDVVAGYEAVPECDEQILGKDASENFWYCYILVIVIFMVIIMYGVMIATAVTTEKSNRCIEILVTSIDATYLMLGKVFAGAVAVVVQLGLILSSALIGYSINHEVWGDKLDAFLDIPAEVLGVFAVFGLGGFLFYAFLYAAMGALASKTEDINKTAGGLQMIIMLVYFVVLAQLQNPDGLLMKVFSYLPFSSYSAMFVRIGMGQVNIWELVVSAVILYASIFFVAWLAGKIYRMGTLRYGNPISFTKALKDMKSAE